MQRVGRDLPPTTVHESRAAPEAVSCPPMKRFLNSVRNLSAWGSFWAQYYALKQPGGAARELEIPLRSGLVALVPGVLMSAFDEVFLREVYARSLSPPLRPAPVVVDIGANAGSFSLWVLSRHPDARVVAFEPLPSHVALLRRQSERNPGLDLTIDPRAVCAQRGPVQIRFDGRNEFSVAASLFAREGADASITVEATTLADLFSEHDIDRCHLLKMDCEGAEYDILFGCPDEVFAATDRIVLEVHAWGQGTGNIEGLVRLLRGKGYRIMNRRNEILACSR